MILGVGIDLVDVPRFQQTLDRQGQAFLKKIAHSEELDHAPSPSSIESAKVEYWAGRFAAKEAFSKALGTGIGKNFSLNEMGVIKAQSGAPVAVVSQRLQTMLNERSVSKIHVSISHTGQNAIAMVILEG